MGQLLDHKAPEEQQQQGGVLQQHAAWASELRQAGVVHERGFGTTWMVCPAAASELLQAHDGAGAGLAKPPKEQRRVLLARALTAVSGADWRRQRPAFEAAAGGGLAAQARRHAEPIRQAGALAVEQAARGSVHDVVELAQRAAARGIVGAVLGPAEQPPSPAWQQVECLTISFLRASRRRRQSRDQAVVSALEAALMRAMYAQAELCVPAAAAGGGGPEEEGQPAAAPPAEQQQQPEPRALLHRLLLRPELSREEAVCNANSCLVAGLETSSDLLACALLHLAANPLLQQAAGGGQPPKQVPEGGGEAPLPQPATAPTPAQMVAAIMRETLRVNPPVMGQPRVVVAPGGVRVRAAAAASNRDHAAATLVSEPGRAAGPGPWVHLPRGFLFAVDLLSAAHGGGPDCSTLGLTGEPKALNPGLPDQHVALHPKPQPCDPDPKNGGSAFKHLPLPCCTPPIPSLSTLHPPSPAGGPSWDWDPLRPSPLDGAPDPLAQAAPFGLGPRACPAGSLSLAVAREVLQQLLASFHWRLRSPGDAAWMDRTVAAPTLVIKGPVGVVFTKKSQTQPAAPMP